MDAGDTAIALKAIAEQRAALAIELRFLEPEARPGWHGGVVILPAERPVEEESPPEGDMLEARHATLDDEIDDRYSALSPPP